ncbi:amidase domain-containing protein [Ornithinibacillus gellani]|uniref:amidase domain-containing protein n=1 Tax=Ornithinibacillus gellani TaxID=2293253 RepID=UPI000F48E987|nr:amidase domain-containing protein [Ornithinibacillus gellani]TQS76561.1 amidase domain-containing protein [Ornithinibacillus gellani]
MDELKAWWIKKLSDEGDPNEWWGKKIAQLAKRDAYIVRVRGKASKLDNCERENASYQYRMHLRLLIKQKNYYYEEEQIFPCRFGIKSGEIHQHHRVSALERHQSHSNPKLPFERREKNDSRFEYDRLSAVQYAERWWNSYNPAYEHFDVDCTNYISQCLHAGGAPMHGAPVREKGWWYSGKSWSFSWSVANAMRWYLSAANNGLQGVAVESADQLLPGDVICYDFQGDGRWDHTTIVVNKDAYGMPLVNAHTDNSRNRYWTYEDSTAYTPEIQYKFFRIGE